MKRSEPRVPIRSFRLILSRHLIPGEKDSFAEIVVMTLFCFKASKMLKNLDYFINLRIKLF